MGAAAELDVSPETLLLVHRTTPESSPIAASAVITLKTSLDIDTSETTVDLANDAPPLPSSQFGAMPASSPNLSPVVASADVTQETTFDIDPETTFDLDTPEMTFDLDTTFDLDMPETTCDLDTLETFNLVTDAPPLPSFQWWAKPASSLDVSPETLLQTLSTTPDPSHLWLPLLYYNSPPRWYQQCVLCGHKSIIDYIWLSIVYPPWCYCESLYIMYGPFVLHC